MVFCLSDPALSCLRVVGGSPNWGVGRGEAVQQGAWHHKSQTLTIPEMTSLPRDLLCCSSCRTVENSSIQAPPEVWA